MILKLSVGEAVQISHIVKMRLGSQKGNDHTAVFMSSDLNESQDTCRMVLSCLPLEEGGKEKAPCHLLQTLSTHTTIGGKGDVRG